MTMNELVDKTKLKLNLLAMRVWTAHEIKAYFSELIKSTTTAYRVKDQARQKGGSVIYGTQFAKVDTILNLFGLTTESEIRFHTNVLRGLTNGNN